MVTERGAAPRLPGVVATVVGLTSFAVAQPLLAILGDGATFFVAHGATSGDLLAFTALVLLGPPVVVGGALLLAYGLAPSRWPVILSATVGLLVAAFVVPALDRAIDLPVPVFLALAALVAFGAAVLHRRAPAARTYAAATGFAPLLFGGLFLFASPASAILDPSGGADGATGGRDHDVVVLVFDEFPLVGLLDDEGQVDPVRFPNFARLASTSTWYADATTVSPTTAFAVPSLLSGVVPPEDDSLPVASEYPRNLMSMLGTSHDVRAMEAITYLCDSSCETERFRSRRLLLRDASTVYLHALLPDGLARRWLPELGDRWTGFTDDGSPSTAEVDRDAVKSDMAVEATLDQGPRTAELLDHLRTPPDGPRVVVGHLLLPHTPYLHLPDGSVYQGRVPPPGLQTDGNWTTDPAVLDVVRQQFLLQLQYVDTLVGEVLDALEEQGALDDTLLVVTSDHGMTLDPGTHRRGLPLTDANLAEIAPVPLFVHYPGQTEPEVDRAPRQIIDLMPTIVDVLDLELDDEWAFDGVSLLDPDPRSERTYLGETEVAVPLDIDLTDAVADYHDLFGDGRPEHDVFAWGPHRDLVGEPAAANLAPEPAPGPTAGLRSDALSRFEPGQPIVPSLVVVDLSGPVDAEWLAVSLDGTVAGLGPVIDEGSGPMARIMVDPALMSVDNEVEVWAVTADGLVRLAPTS